MLHAAHAVVNINLMMMMMMIIDDDDDDDDDYGYKKG